MTKQRRHDKEPPLEWLASFVHFFILLFLFKSFFLPLFVIPTGSMAETLCGAHATHTCPNCGWEYQIGFHQPRNMKPAVLECPNCRFRQNYDNQALGRRLRETFGDRITVWPYEFGLGLSTPRRWDVVVFRNPQDPEMNFIKRMIGLPGETVEIIDGDIFIDGQIQRKPSHVQETLWFPYYDHDYQPEVAGGAQDDYFPRWTPITADSDWQLDDTRTLVHADAAGPRDELLFVTNPDADARPGIVQDIYGYNAPVLVDRAISIERLQTVTDTRLRCEVQFEAGDGYVELSTTKFRDRVFARLHADGRLELAHEDLNTRQREVWGEANGVNTSQPVMLSLANADYRATVTVNGEIVLQTTPAQFNIDPDTARRRSFDKLPPELRIAAEEVNVSLRQVRIYRDIYYTSDVRMRMGPDGASGPGWATQGNPLALRDKEYFVLGDNSPNSADGRLWSMAGPHLRGEDSDYVLGTVPQDQLIGRAFMVYLPGFLPLPYDAVNAVPDLGRIRWIY